MGLAPRGGKREGAGRPRGTTQPTATAVRLAPDLKARVDALRDNPHGYTLPEIIRAGVEALEAKHR